MTNWRQILSWRGAEEIEENALHEFVICWTGYIDGYSKVTATNMDEALQLARNGGDHGFYTGETGDDWHIWRVEDLDSGESMDV